MDNSNTLNSVQRAAEEVNKRNIKAAVDYSNETRKITRELEIKIQELKNMVYQQNQVIDQLKTQINTLLIKNYSTKATK